MSAERLSPKQEVVFIQCTKKAAKNVSRLLSEPSEIVTIPDTHKEGGEVKLIKSHLKKVMFGFIADVEGLGFSFKDAKEMLESTPKPIALGPKKG